MRKSVIYLGLLALVVAVGMLLTGCGEKTEVKETKLDPTPKSFVEEIIVEEIVVETIEDNMRTLENS